MLTVTGSIGITKDSSGNQVYPPILCGENTGQHVYLDAGRASNSDITLMNTFDTGATFGRKWNIKVSQIPCDATSAPPSADCLQYFTGLQDTVKSFNFDGGPPVSSNQGNTQFVLKGSPFVLNFSFPSLSY